MTERGGGAMRRGGLYVLFFLSGVSALSYELAWQRCWRRIAANGFSLQLIPASSSERQLPPYPRHNRHVQPFSARSSRKR